MGIAELVPGVSGGTIAFITGIYMELVHSLRSVDRAFGVLLLRGRLAGAWRHVNASFLLILLTGIGSALVLCARLVSWMFEHRAIESWAFFLGLIVASLGLMVRAIDVWSLRLAGLALLGLVAGAALSNLGGLPAGDSLLVTFAASALAICAWILPGVSGSFVLLLLGQYRHVLRAIVELDVMVLASVGAGCVLGLALFTRVLAWCLRYYYQATLALLCGFMGGALQKLWPWQQTLSYYLDPRGEAVPVLVRPIGPLRFQELYGEDPLLLGAGVACALGLGLVLGLDLAARRGSA